MWGKIKAVASPVKYRRKYQGAQKLLSLKFKGKRDPLSGIVVESRRTR